MKNVFAVIVALSISSLTQAYGGQPTESPNTNLREQREAASIRSLDDGLNQARQSVHRAVANKDWRILGAGLTSPSYTIRSETLRALVASFSPAQQRAAISLALLDDTAWKEEIGGEERTIQRVYFLDLGKALQALGIRVQGPDYLEPGVRHAICEDLSRAVQNQK